MPLIIARVEQPDRRMPGRIASEQPPVRGDERTVLFDCERQVHAVPKRHLMVEGQVQGFQ